MGTIKIRTRVDVDGNVVIPVDISRAGEEVDVTISPLPLAHTLTPEEWVAWLRQTAGSCPDLPDCDEPPVQPPRNSD